MRRKPKITVACECGRTEQVEYGAEYTCECGRRYTTSQIPERDYAAVVQLDRRYRLGGQLVGSFFALIFIAVALTRPITLVAVVPSCLLAWMIYGRPFVRRRYWRAVRQLTREWKLSPTPGSSPKTP
jgi:hypothetical protein